MCEEQKPACWDKIKYIFQWFYFFYIFLFHFLLLNYSLYVAVLPMDM